MNITIRINEDDGWLIASVDEIPGCNATGQTLPELFEALIEAMQMTDDDIPF